METKTLNEIRSKRRMAAGLESRLEEIEADREQAGRKAIAKFRATMGSGAWHLAEPTSAECEEKAAADVVQISTTLQGIRDFLASHILTASDEAEIAKSPSASKWAQAKTHEVMGY